VRVSGLAEISAGWESDMYSFAIESGPAGARQCDELILRIYPGDDALDKSAREYHGMSLLHGAGYPVPRVLVLERGDKPFDRPFVIMERIEGQMMWPLLFGAPEGRQQELLTLFCKLFVRLHALEWGSFAEILAGHAQDRPFGRAQDRPWGGSLAPSLCPPQGWGGGLTPCIRLMGPQSIHHLLLDAENGI